MRILVANVNTSESMTATIAESARRAAETGTEIVPLSPRFGVRSVDTSFEGYLAAVAVMDVVTAYEGAYDAVVMAGFADYGRDGLQELISQPVLEICEASAHVAMMIGRSYSVVTTLQRSVAAVEDRLRISGLDSRCASVRATDLTTREVDEDPTGSAEAVLREARHAVEDDRAEVICLGCAGLAGIESQIESSLGVPVIDGVAAAVKLAEALVGLGLRTSKISTYAFPEEKEIAGWPVAPAPTNSGMHWVEEN